MKINWTKGLFLAAAALVVAWTFLIFCIIVMIAEPDKAEGAIFRSSATCYDLTGNPTASGAGVGPRVAAHNFIPFRTKIRIVGRQTGPLGRRLYIVRDTGPALSDGHFDLWSYKGVCARFGHRSIQWKYGWGKPRTKPRAEASHYLHLADARPTDCPT